MKETQASTNKHKCPACKGTGEIDFSPRHVEDHQRGMKQIVAETLIKSGYSFRQIAKILGYKSPRSVQYLLDKRL